MPKRHADSTQEKTKAAKRRKLSADEVLVEAARNGDTTAVRAGLEKWTPDTDSKKFAFDAAHEACRGNHDECLTLLLPYVETTQMGFGMLLSECVHADRTACTEVLLQHWKSVCSNVAFVPHGLEEDSKGRAPRACPAMWADPAVCQVLIDAGADIEAKNDKGRSPLLMACELGKLDAVKMLVKASADVCATDNQGATCLMLAAYFGHTETVRYLVGLPVVEVNHEQNVGETALHFAVPEGHRDVVEVLIDAGADIEANNGKGRSPLLMACVLGKLDTVKMLVEAGAAVCATDDQGDTCLTLAAYFGHTDIVRYLVGLPDVDVNYHGRNNDTALHSAVDDGHRDVVELLIDAGADIEAQDSTGETPLHYACENGKLAILKMLLKAGADVCATDNRGTTCLMRAVHHGHTETVRYLVGLPDVDVNAAKICSYTSLHSAVIRNNGSHPEVVQMLIDAGADMEAKNENGCSSLLVACKVGKLDAVKLLVEAGARVCATDDHGATCLIAAAYFGHTETVRYLVGLPDVDVNLTANEGETALDYASGNSHRDVVHVLLEHGAVCSTDCAGHG